LEAQIRKLRPDALIELISSSGGVFEVTRNGELIYSKRATGHHPTWEEIEQKL
jgi:selT/selW/selH-like putative selenoprotein